MKKDFSRFLENITKLDAFLKFFSFSLFIVIPTITLNKLASYLGIPVSLVSNLNTMIAIIIFYFVLFIVVLIAISFMYYLTWVTFKDIKNKVKQNCEIIHLIFLLFGSFFAFLLSICIFLIFSFSLKSFFYFWLSLTTIIVIIILLFSKEIRKFFSCITSLFVLIIYIFQIVDIPLIVLFLVINIFGTTFVFLIIFFILIVLVFYILFSEGKFKSINPLKEEYKNIDFFYIKLYLGLIVFIFCTVFASNETIFSVFKNYFFDKKIVIVITKQKKMTNTTKTYKGYLINIYNNYLIFRTDNDKTLIIPKENVELLEILNKK
jgi:hypothetical protein